MKAPVKYRIPATHETFDEVAYLEANKDVAEAVRTGQCESGWSHFLQGGHSKNRFLSFKNAVTLAKKDKVNHIMEFFLRKEMYIGMHPSGAINCLSKELADSAQISETAAISSHDYDNIPLQFILNNPSAWILDAGAGLKPIYYNNVVNFEIVPYDTTDVLGIAEELPFKENSFDFVISAAVLEHVHDPFKSAQELYRVLKPGGSMFVGVPFLFPYHGYPHHYYNMTVQGARNLFPREMEDVQQRIPHYFWPLWAAKHFFQLWASALRPATREQFLDMPIREIFTASVNDYTKPYVSELNDKMKTILAYGSTLTGRKPK